MRRHSSLRDLSSDHHQALVQAHRLQRAASADDATRRKFVAEFLQFWHEHAQRHFCEEEQALLPYFARWGELNQEPIHQMLREHALIRCDAALLEAGKYDESTCRALGTQLEAHVRLEERVIFPLIEAALPEAALRELPAALEAWHSANPANARMKENMMTKTAPAPENGSTLHQSNLPGANLQTHKMPGHWLLARLGKKVLRPGGLELTRHLLESLDIQSSDSVVEFAPGLGATAQLTLEKNPASYIAVERDADAVETIRQKLEGPNREFLVGSADATGLPDACATVVYGEAILTMQTPETKKRIVAEAARLLKPGGRYGIHEISLLPDELDESTQDEISAALGGAIHVGARPLRLREWRDLLESCDFKVEAEHHSPMELLEPARIIADEGVSGALHIFWNALHDEEALARVREMRAVFRKYRDHLGAVALVAIKQ
jgi:ubiquinone/menaquinone biosynthesis C-methylase UbiE/hemerythrin-like domain-containing protein